MGRVDSTIERSLPVFSEWSQPDVLSRLGAFRVPVVAPASLGGPDVDPARCPVDGAGVARGLDEGLRKHHTPLYKKAPHDRTVRNRSRSAAPDTHTTVHLSPSSACAIRASAVKR